LFGVPAFFAAEWREDLLSLCSDRGAQRLFHEHRDQLAIVPLARAED
jgi:hypothetical protein